MITMALPSVVGFSAVIAGAVVALLSVFIVKRPSVNLPDAHDPDREYRKLEMRLRHPWKARISRLLGD